MAPDLHCVRRPAGGRSRMLSNTMTGPTFFTNPEAFDRWLEEHGGSVSVLWVGYFTKGTGQPSLSWADSVEVALCHGWIDGIRRSIDRQRYMIRFTPRKPNSIWSAVNVQKSEALVRRGKMTAQGLRLFNARKDKGGYSSATRKVPLDPLFEARLKAIPVAWTFFSNLAPSSRRDSIWWVMGAKSQATRLRRLEILIASSQRGLKVPVLRRSAGIDPPGSRQS